MRRSQKNFVREGIQAIEEIPKQKRQVWSVPTALARLGPVVSLDASSTAIVNSPREAARSRDAAYSQYQSQSLCEQQRRWETLRMELLF
ncbi:unnamed protein product [Caenorhabditis auriculariae]|uniref:Uncharacterized protein n=1 Tax=Caenorhabditis auriculariae TaxID=2777116 RepID=A0A8S1GP28_9PELO|nr:unnamed protein product [Caenorhabditis auriculariae]